MTPLWTRILVEKRPLIVPLVIAIVINVGVYAFVVRPLELKSVGAATRAEEATAALKGAEADYAAARALVAGKTRADEELATFYDKVLPADLSSARRLTYPISELAKKSGVKFAERRTDVDEKDTKRSGLARLAVHVVLQGDYESLRHFIFDLETAPEFLIIDDVTLSQGDQAKPLTLAIDLSTYYRPSGNGI
jgi:Tfp pilus assembly protein PilO